jgi:hypothetical protein
VIGVGTSISTGVVAAKAVCSAARKLAGQERQLVRTGIAEDGPDIVPAQESVVFP